MPSIENSSYIVTDRACTRNWIFVYLESAENTKMSVEPIERLGSIQYSPKLPERVPNEVPKISAGVYKLHLDLLCAYWGWSSTGLGTWRNNFSNINKLIDLFHYMTSLKNVR